MPLRPLAPRRRIVARGVLVATLVALGAADLAPPAGAQARLVNALVHTVPERPAPGDDVTVIVDVEGCPAGAVTAEIYLTTTEGGAQENTLVTRAPATTNLWRRTRAVLALPEAYEGWYGARILCGTYRPPKEAMANTLFAVGAVPTKQSRLAVDHALPGGAIAASGDGCPGTTVEYDVGTAARWAGPFDTDGTIGVGPDGTWSGDIVVPADATPGPATVRVRCVLSTQFGEPVHVYYGGLPQVTVDRPAA